MELQIQFMEFAKLIQDARNSAFTRVNRGLIDFYWKMGEHLSRKTQEDGWDKNIMRSFSKFLGDSYPGLKSFSTQNMLRMQQFYECYKDQPELLALLRELRWTNNLVIFSKSKTDEEREFYIRLCINEKYSSTKLKKQINSGFFERCMLTDAKAPTVIANVPESPAP